MAGAAQQLWRFVIRVWEAPNERERFDAETSLLLQNDSLAEDAKAEDTPKRNNLLAVPKSHDCPPLQTETKPR